jgi:type I restriction enzyme S subunit
MNKLNKLIEKLCPDGIKYKELGEVCEFKRGQTITKKEKIDGVVPVISGGKKPAYYHKFSNRQSMTIAVSGSGANSGYVSFWKKPIFLNDGFSVHPNSFLSIEYVYYFLKDKQDKIYTLKKGSGVPHVYSKDLAKLKIPVPPLEVQNEIVEKLDKFDKLVNDISEGLPAEIKMRQDQYKYYLDKLLTFEKRKK